MWTHRKGLITPNFEMELSRYVRKRAFRTESDQSILKYTENFSTRKKKKNGNFQIKNSDIFHIAAQNIDWGGSNEYPQCMLLSKNKKNSVYFF